MRLHNAAVAICEGVSLAVEDAFVVAAFFATGFLGLAAVAAFLAGAGFFAVARGGIAVTP